MGTANINIFVSSTCYDLSQIRNDIRDSITGWGHNPILSEQNDFPIDPQLDNWENCINAVKNFADIFVLIVGEKYGSTGKTGKSITNTEYLTAVQKGIPIYTFTSKRMVTLLEAWKLNPSVKLSEGIDDNNIFKFINEVRSKSGRWNFEYDTALDIIDTLRKQLSILFRNSLELRKKIVSSPYEDLYSKISSKALNILMQKEESYDIKFFMQVMMDGINDCRDYKNDYQYSIILKPLQERRTYKELIKWIEFKFDELMSYIGSLQKLSEAFKVFYKEKDDESDLRGLHYVANTYVEFYVILLKWGTSVKGMIVPEEFNEVMAVLSEMPSSIINEMEKYPKEATEKIPICIEKLRNGTLEKEDLIEFPFEINVPGSVIARYNQELDELKIRVMKRTMDL